MRGYYSIIQYCPDMSRAEAANVGLVLITQELRVCCDMDMVRVKRFFDLSEEDLEYAQQSLESFERRVLNDDKLAKLSNMAGFIATRANQFKMTPLRNCRVTQIDETLSRLFQALVIGK